MNTRNFGDQGENVAAGYLRKNGYRIRAQKFCAPMGEIDIVAEFSGEIIFAEVKTRRSIRFGLPSQAVNWRKQRKIILTAQCYIQQYRLEERNCRFVILEVYCTPAGSWSVRHLKNAFEVG